MQADPDRIERNVSRRFRKVIAKSLEFVMAVIARSHRVGAKRGPMTGSATKQSSPTAGLSGLLRGVYHRARIRATRWLAMTTLISLSKFQNQRVDGERGASGRMNFLHRAVAFG